MADFRIAQGARRPSIRATLLSAGEPMSLSGTTVRFVAWTADGWIIGGPATIESASQGQVRYDWADGDTNVPGTYQAEWRVEYSDDRVMAVPSDRHSHVRVTGGSPAAATNGGNGGNGNGDVDQKIAAAIAAHVIADPAHDADVISLDVDGLDADRVGAGLVELAASIAGLDAGDVGADPAGTAAGLVTAHEQAHPAHTVDQIEGALEQSVMPLWDPPTADRNTRVLLGDTASRASATNTSLEQGQPRTAGWTILARPRVLRTVSIRTTSANAGWVHVGMIAGHDQVIGGPITWLAQFGNDQDGLPSGTHDSSDLNVLVPAGLMVLVVWAGGEDVSAINGTVPAPIARWSGSTSIALVALSGLMNASNTGDDLPATFTNLASVVLGDAVAVPTRWEPFE